MEFKHEERVNGIEKVDLGGRKRAEREIRGLNEGYGGSLTLSRPSQP